LGKPYGKDLEKLDSTYNWAIETSIDELITFVRSSSGFPMLSIGSGGSLTAASFASILHQQIGTISKYLTPLEFISTKTSMHDKSILFLTARGRNSDILKSFKIAASREPRHIMALCTTKGSPLSHIASDISYANFSEFDLPSGKDGFLATNSLLAMMVFLARSYLDHLSTPFKFPASLRDLVHPDISRQEFIKKEETNIQPLINRDTFVVLYNNWGKPAALDIESKFIEAALGHIQIADYRNFAHGRHNWLAKKGDETGVIALITPEERWIADKTFDLLPKNIPLLQITTERNGPIGSIDLLIKVLYLVHIVGVARYIDPGKPNIPTFGRRMYNLRLLSNDGYAFKQYGMDNREEAAILRKVGYSSLIQIEGKELEFMKEAYHEYILRLEHTFFGAVIFDYDGTLCDPNKRYNGPPEEICQELERLLRGGVFIGIATGRGKSARVELQCLIPNKYWDQILIGYYNGSEIAPLKDNNHPDRTIPSHVALQSIKDSLENHQQLCRAAKYEFRPNQITVEPINEALWRKTKSILLDIISSCKSSHLQNSKNVVYA
jgi:hypothetical protein